MEMTMDETFTLDELVPLLVARGLDDVEIVHTGGGNMAIYAGPVVDEDEGRILFAAGPAEYELEGRRNVATFGDFYFGPDEWLDVEHESALEPVALEVLADRMAAMYRRLLDVYRNPSYRWAVQSRSFDWSWEAWADSEAEALEIMERMSAEQPFMDWRVQRVADFEIGNG